MTGPAARAAALLFALCCITPVLAHQKAPPSEAVAVAGLNAALGAEAAKGGPDAAKGQMTRSERPVDPRP
jgi:hypothetical protein